MTKVTSWLILSLCSFSLWSFADNDVVPESEMVPTPGVIGFVPKDGIFVAGDLGLFAAIMGYTTTDAANKIRTPVTMSGIEPFVGLTVGYDFSRNFGLGLKLANGSVAKAARSQTDFESPTDFGLYLVDLNLMGAISLTSRFRLVLNGFGGLTLMSPPITLGAQPYGANAGATIGILYDTLLADMVVGLNIGGYAFFNFSAAAGADQVFYAASVTPVLKYVF